jgi:hypothetical protein
LFFFNSKELSEYVHSRGINVRYLGHIYRYLKTQVQREVVMSELAARCCKTLLRKTVQDLTLEERVAGKEFNGKLCDFLNCVLGNTYETAALWKLLSAHSKSYFGVELNFSHIQRGYFLVSLVQNCSLEVVWERVNPEEVFKINNFFSERNLQGLKPKHKIYPPFYNQQFQNTIRVISAP